MRQVAPRAQARIGEAEVVADPHTQLRIVIKEFTLITALATRMLFTRNSAQSKQEGVVFQPSFNVRVRNFGAAQKPTSTSIF